MMQIVIGLAMYAYGLRDGGFELLNTFGMSCSIAKVRKMANKWAEKRKCVDEVDKTGFWRVTFDNLNFKRKFAKTFTAGGTIGGRMLNLLTGQVSFRSENQNTPTVENNPNDVHNENDFTTSEHDQGVFSNFKSKLVKVEDKRLKKW